MTIYAELFVVFLMSLLLSLLLTPAVGALGIKLGAMDFPGERKVHGKPIPRIGGLAIFIAYVTTIGFANAFLPIAGDLYVCNFEALLGHAGGILILLCGLADDYRRLPAWIKLLFQILAASLAFAGGVTISHIPISDGIGFTLGPILSYLVTVFWFLLFINAVNLIDGLDGLACGLIFFTCAVMALSTYYHGTYLATFYFVILGGAVLGFLRYNFNPANIFLGDGGSYFLGYAVALLAIRSSTKSHVSILMLIPLLALGVPIFDSILVPVRRWILGKNMFHPDRGHIHHHLLKMGLSTRNAVLLIYGITMVFCCLSILLLLLRGKGMEGLLLALLLLVMMIICRKLGYIEYLTMDKFLGWFQDIMDVAGLSQNRRTFLSLQIAMGKSQNLDEMWDYLTAALQMLRFDSAQLYLDGKPVRKWQAKDGESGDCAEPEGLLKMEIPLQSENDGHFWGKIILVKDLRRENLQRFTIRRVEHLRRTLVDNLRKIKIDKPVQV